MMEEQKFKDQLREGFLELRNHQQNKAAASSSGAGSTGMHRPSSQNNMYGSGGMGPAGQSGPPTGVVAPNPQHQQHMVPRNRGQNEAPRPLSMHGTTSSGMWSSQ